MPRKKKPPMTAEERQLLNIEPIIFPYPPFDSNDYVIAQLIAENSATRWLYGKEYLIRETWNGHYRDPRLPSGRQPRINSAILGDFLIATKNLIEKVHYRHENYCDNLPWKSGSSWFEECFLNFITTEAYRLISGSVSLIIDLSRKSIGRKTSLREAIYQLEHIIVKQLNDEINPYEYVPSITGTSLAHKKICDKLYYPRALHTLIDLSLKMIRDSDVLRKEEWHNFKSAHRTYVKQISDTTVSSVSYCPLEISVEILDDNQINELVVNPIGDKIFTILLTKVNNILQVKSSMY